MKYLVFLFFIFTLLCPSGAGADPVFPYEGRQVVLNTGLGVEEFKPHLLSEESYTESWYHQIESKDGHKLFISYMITNIGPGGGKPGIKATLVTPGGERFFYKGEYKSKELNFNPEKLRLQIGPNWIEAQPPGYKIFIKEGELEGEFTYHHLLPGFRKGGGRVYFGEKRGDFWDYSVQVPRALVTGRFTHQGKSWEISGYGYADHSYQNLLSSSFSNRWYSMRIFDEQFTVGFVEIITTKKYEGERVKLLMVTDQEKVLLLTSDYELKPTDFTTDEVTGYQYPQGFELRVKNGGCKCRPSPGLTLEGTIRADKMIERLEVLESVGFFQRKLIETLVARPVFMKFANRYDLNLRMGEETKNLKGQGVHEVVCIE